MPNLLPKNLNLSNTQNFLGYNKEKQLNLNEVVEDHNTKQEERIVNFILFLGLILGFFTCFLNYLNLSSNKTYNLDYSTSQNIEYIKSKEIRVTEIKNDIEFLSKFQGARNSIKIKQGVFYSELNSLLNYLKNPSLESIQFNQSENIFTFKITFFSGDDNTEQKIKDYIVKNNKIKNMKLENVEKINETKTSKYTFSGEIDGR